MNTCNKTHNKNIQEKLYIWNIWIIQIHWPKSAKGKNLWIGSRPIKLNNSTLYVIIRKGGNGLKIYRLNEVHV